MSNFIKAIFGIKEEWQPRYEKGDVVWAAPVGSGRGFIDYPRKVTIVKPRTNPDGNHGDGYVATHEYDEYFGRSESEKKSETIFVKEADIIGIVEEESNV